jgi:hypothetical protein
MKTILKFDDEAFNITSQDYQNSASMLNNLLSYYRDVTGMPIQNEQEGQAVRNNPIQAIREAIAKKSDFSGRPFDFQLDSTGLRMQYGNFMSYLEGKEQLFKQDIFKYNQGYFEVSEQALNRLKEDCTIYATDEQIPKLIYFQKLAESLNNGIEIGYISDYHRSQICRSISGLSLDVEQGKYKIGLNIAVLFNS